MSVLIVDDHAGFRAMARRMLESEGLEVVGEAGDGAAAIAAVRTLQPDIVLLDVQLPDADGRELAAELAPARVILTSTRSRGDLGELLHAFVPKAELSAARLMELAA
jgi:DNA-binding NarL/FixJ family response regulator